LDVNTTEEPDRCLSKAAMTREFLNWSLARTVCRESWRANSETGLHNNEAAFFI
jgi:hypothetical protein